MKVKAGLESAAQDWMVLLLAGLGISLAPHVFWGGMFLALCGAMIARHVQPEKDRHEIWWVLLAAGVMAILAAEAISWAQATDRLAPQFPVQMAMAAAGFGSRFIITFALRLMGRVETRADQVSDRIIDRVLPDKKDDDK
jgi:hypothetical protein